jgi:diacylglycerol kinase (ATP)
MAPVQFIANPNSGGGRGAAILRRLPAYIASHPGCEILTTRARGEAIEMARGAAAGGARLVVAVGGDGTLHEVINGVLAAGKPECAVALLPGGRGSDFARGTGIPAEMDAALALLDGPDTPVDVGRITAGGRTWHFLNVADVGIGGFVVQIVNRWRLPIGGLLTYMLATFWTLASYGGSPMRMRWEGDESGEIEGRFISVAVANGPYFGGGMHIAPGALAGDGLFDVVAIRQVGKLKSATLAPALYRGKIREHRWAHSFRCRKITLESTDTVPMDLDGELAPNLPAAFEIVPGALKFKLPADVKLR